MAKVFLAHDLKYDRAVAVKVLRPDLAAEVGATRFLREIQIAARLHHPHILPLYDSDQVDGLVYYVMPYIEGETLRDRLARERQLPIGDALQIAREVADALNYAHGAKVIHRDIKPANILLEGGHALVMDFGIARAIGGGEALTQQIIGTPAYMSPEQIDGRAYIDGRSDIYSLGCVLFEMLVGEPPFGGSTIMGVIANRLTTPTPSPRAFRELVPEAVDAAVRKAMATLPADRFSTAAQFADALGTSATVAIAVGAAQAMVQEINAPKSVAVLPFENMSTDPENEYFSDGITGDIIAQLSKISALKVISRTSSMRYKKTTKTMTAVAQELAVGAILEGSVRRVGPRVRIVAHLINPATEQLLWGETFDRQLADVFEVQSEVAERISGALSVALSPAEKQRVETKPTGNTDAYNLYLLGRHHANKWSEANVEKAIDYFQLAIAKAPRDRDRARDGACAHRPTLRVRQRRWSALLHHAVRRRGVALRPPAAGGAPVPRRRAPHHPRRRPGPGVRPWPRGAPPGREAGKHPPRRRPGPGGGFRPGPGHRRRGLSAAYPDGGHRWNRPLHEPGAAPGRPQS
jgi:serine/threonine-protein kinase